MPCADCEHSQAAYHGGWWRWYCLHPGPAKGRLLCTTKKEGKEVKRTTLLLIGPPEWCLMNQKEKKEEYRECCNL